MVEWATEYVSDLDDIRDGTYCFEHDCPPTAQGLAQTEFLPFAALALPFGGLTLLPILWDEDFRDEILESFSEIVMHNNED